MTQANQTLETVYVHRRTRTVHRSPFCAGPMRDEVHPSEVRDHDLCGNCVRGTIVEDIIHDTGNGHRREVLRDDQPTDADEDEEDERSLLLRLRDWWSR